MKYNVIYKVHDNCVSKLNFSIVQSVHGTEVAISRAVYFMPLLSFQL